MLDAESNISGECMLIRLSDEAQYFAHNYAAIIWNGKDHDILTVLLSESSQTLKSFRTENCPRVGHS
jgi:hypothetical protein